MADSKTTKPKAEQATPGKPLTALEEQAVASAKTRTKNGTTHIEKARKARLADFQQKNKE